MGPYKHALEKNAVYGDEEFIKNELNIEVPSRYVCPITMEVMIHPVKTSSGFNFEGLALVNWLVEGNETCPLSRKPLDKSSIERNIPLEEEIARWRFHNFIPDPYDDVEHLKPTKTVTVTKQRLYNARSA